MTTRDWARAIVLLLILLSTAYGALNLRTEPLTLEQCRDSVGKMQQVREFVSAHPNLDPQDMIDAAAIQCVVNHDPSTASLSLDRRIEATAQRYCAAKVAKAIPTMTADTPENRAAFINGCVPAVVKAATEEAQRRSAAGK